MYGAGRRHLLCTLMKQDCKMLLAAPIGSPRPLVLFRQLEAYGQWIVMYDSCKYSGKSASFDWSYVTSEAHRRCQQHGI